MPVSRYRRHATRRPPSGGRGGDRVSPALGGAGTVGRSPSSWEVVDDPGVDGSGRAARRDRPALHRPVRDGGVPVGGLGPAAGRGPGVLVRAGPASRRSGRSPATTTSSTSAPTPAAFINGGPRLRLASRRPRRAACGTSKASRDAPVRLGRPTSPSTWCSSTTPDHTELRSLVARSLHARPVPPDGATRWPSTPERLRRRVRGDAARPEERADLVEDLAVRCRWPRSAS